MKTRASMEIFDYWNDRRGHRAAPSRSEIDPAQLRHVLPDLFTLADDGGGCPTFRLTGTRLYNLFGYDLRGERFSTIWHRSSRPLAFRIVTGVMKDSIPVKLDIQTETGHGSDSQEFEMLLLPLQAEANHSPRLLGALLSNPPIGDFGYRFKPLVLQRSWLLNIPLSRPPVPSHSHTNVRYRPVSL